MARHKMLHKIKSAKAVHIPTTPMTTKDLINTLDLRDAGVLEHITNRVADFIENEASQDIYTEAVREAAASAVAKLKLPRWLSFLKGFITNVFVDWLMKNGIVFITQALRGIAKGK
tara:strand:- start:4902 stop:5249 length:348 start_codon:yes stop_codon:yes gene_type:complete